MPDTSTSTEASPTTSETIECLLNRVSVRKYSDQPVTEETIEAVLKAAFRAPTSSNIQSYTAIVVRDPETKQKLSVTVNNQRHVALCPVFIAFCADLRRIEYAMNLHQHNLDNNNLEVGLVSSVDAALVGMSAYLAAESVGLRGLMIGAVRNDPEKVGEILGLPKRVYCVFGMCLGWPAEFPPQKPRMDTSMTIHYEKYDEKATVAAMGDYDKALAEHYTSRGVATTPDSWTHDIDNKFAARQRDKLREQLGRMGFDFS